MVEGTPTVRPEQPPCPQPGSPWEGGSPVHFAGSGILNLRGRADSCDHFFPPEPDAGSSSCRWVLTAASSSAPFSLLLCFSVLCGDLGGQGNEMFLLGSPSPFPRPHQTLNGWMVLSCSFRPCSQATPSKFKFSSGPEEGHRLLPQSFLAH